MSSAQQYAPVPSFATEAAAYAEPNARASFIRKTYSHLFMAIAAFVCLEFVIFGSGIGEEIATKLLSFRYGFLLAIIGFMGVSWLARSWAESSGSPAKAYAGLFLYVVAEAIIFVPILYLAQRFETDGRAIILPAAVVTLIVFGGLTALVMLSAKDFSFLRTALFLGGMLAVGTVIVAMIFGLNLGIWFTIAMIGLACGYILYDTSNVLHHYRTDQYCAASLALFASVAILFFYILRLFMRSRD